MEHIETSELMRVIHDRDIETRYQPIVRLDTGTIIGYEALSRGPSTSALRGPLDLLKTAEQNDMLWDLEFLFRSLAIERAHGLSPLEYLFLNVDPKIIRDPKFEKGLTKEYLAHYGISPDMIIFEITERTAIEDYETFKAVLDVYTSQGYKIAIDDAGSGYSGMNTIVETKPHFIKIDMNIIRNIQNDTFKQAIVRSFVQLGQSTNVQIIAEGIETSDELRTLIHLGVYAGQGYLFKRPSQNLDRLDSHIIDMVLHFNHLADTRGRTAIISPVIGSLAIQQQGVNPDMSIETLASALGESSSEGVCVCVDGLVNGLLTKQNLQSFQASHGALRDESRPWSEIMYCNPLTVDYSESLFNVVEMAMARSDQRLYDPIIVTRNGAYHGLVTVKQLLQHAAASEADRLAFAERPICCGNLQSLTMKDENTEVLGSSSQAC